MRQQPRLLQHDPRHALEILQRAERAGGSESGAGHGVALLRLVAERERGFLAVRGFARARDREHLFRREVGAFEAPRRLGEGALVADVPA